MYPKTEKYKKFTNQVQFAFLKFFEMSDFLGRIWVQN